jgi:hypothetical protein
MSLREGYNLVLIYNRMVLILRAWERRKNLVFDIAI